MPPVWRGGQERLYGKPTTEKVLRRGDSSIKNIVGTKLRRSTCWQQIKTGVDLVCDSLCIQLALLVSRAYFGVWLVSRIVWYSKTHMYVHRMSFWCGDTETHAIYLYVETRADTKVIVFKYWF